MKIPILVSLFVVGIMNLTYSQELLKYKKYYENIKESESVVPMSAPAFDRYITQHFSYTLLGASMPTTALKVETANPKIALRGVVFKNKGENFISTLELETGVDGTIMDLFSESRLNKHFKGSLGFNYLFGESYGAVFANKANYSTPNQKVPIHYRNLAIKRFDVLMRNDSITKIKRVMLTDDFLKKPTLTMIKEKLPDYTQSERLPELTKSILLEMNIEHQDLDSALCQYAKIWNMQEIQVVESEKKRASFLANYKSNQILSKNALDSLLRYEIAQVEHLYTSKYIWWINLSPFVTNTNFKLLTDNAFFLNDRSSFTYGLKASVNFLQKISTSHRFTYVSVTFAPQKMNNLDEMDKYTYKSTRQIRFSNEATPNVTESLTEEEVGIGYEGQYKEGFGMEVSVQLYSVFARSSYLPGLYIDLGINHAEHRLNMRRLSANFGMVWNVTSDVKDSKNLLTVIPFAGWSNLLPQYTAQNQVGKKPLHQLFIAGVQVGVPINLKR